MSGYPATFQLHYLEQVQKLRSAWVTLVRLLRRFPFKLEVSRFIVFFSFQYDDTLKMLEKEERKLAGKRMKEENCRTELARRQKRLDLIHGRGGMKAAFDNEEDYMAWLLEEKRSVAKQVTRTRGN